MRSGDLFLEVSSAKKATALIKPQKLAHLDITMATHSNLNFSRGVTSPADFLKVSTEEIKENMKAQKVCDVRHAQFDRTYQIRCFQCQRYGHSKNVCRGQPTCPRCGESDHDSSDCTKKEQCVNCKGEHPAYSCSCPTWIKEKEITAIKIKEKISYPEALRVVLSRTPVSGKSYASAARKCTSDKATQFKGKEDNGSDMGTPTKPEVIAASKGNHQLSLKRRARQRDLRPTIPKIPKETHTSRDFHRNVEDTVTRDCSEEDEALMDYQSGPPTSSSGGGANAAQ
ncbi:uncharacterized protein TNCV_1149511 [Trichonephila clavipes]|nr:uncharacterized protein TNCV_1149511 [Trichonephila clavipes]